MLQECLENYLFVQYDENRKPIEAAIERIKGANLAYLPDEYQQRLHESFQQAEQVFDRVAAVREAEKNLADYAAGYRPLHVEVRQIQQDIRDLGDDIDSLDQTRQRLKFADDVDEQRIADIEDGIAEFKARQQALKDKIPQTWEDAHARFKQLATAEKRARQQYRQSVDDSYAVIRMLRKMIDETPALAAYEDRFVQLHDAVTSQEPEQAMQTIESLEDELNKLTETYRIVGKLSKARRALRGPEPDTDKALANIVDAGDAFEAELEWRQRAEKELSQDLEAYNNAIADTIGVRMQTRLNGAQAESVASCLAIHKDLTLYF